MRCRLPLGPDAASEYKEIGLPQSKGVPIDPVDRLIARYDKAKNIALVTNNLWGFAWVLGLSLSNWAEQIQAPYSYLFLPLTERTYLGKNPSQEEQCAFMLWIGKYRLFTSYRSLNLLPGTFEVSGFLNWRPLSSQRISYFYTRR